MTTWNAQMSTAGPTSAVVSNLIYLIHELINLKQAMEQVLKQALTFWPGEMTPDVKLHRRPVPEKTKNDCVRTNTLIKKKEKPRSPYSNSKASTHVKSFFQASKVSRQSSGRKKITASTRKPIDTDIIVLKTVCE